MSDMDRLRSFLAHARLWMPALRDDPATVLNALQEWHPDLYANLMLAGRWLTLDRLTEAQVFRDLAIPESARDWFRDVVKELVRRATAPEPKTS